MPRYRNSELDGPVVAAAAADDEEAETFRPSGAAASEGKKPRLPDLASLSAPARRQRRRRRRKSTNERPRRARARSGEATAGTNLGEEWPEE